MNPSSSIDLFEPDALRAPYPRWRALRDLGETCYLEQHGFYFAGRFSSARKILRDWESFSSAQGIGLNDDWNSTWNAALINTDPPHHTLQRKWFTERLSPAAVRHLEVDISARAAELIAGLRDRGRFDAVRDLAWDLPINVIMDLIGWPRDENRPKLIEMADAWFCYGGPENDLTSEARKVASGIIPFLAETVEQGRLSETGFGHDLLMAHRNGELPYEALIGLLAGYVVAAFDTTIATISSGCWLFATHPDQWQRLREDPSLVQGAMNEVLRYESPAMYFARVATRDVEFDDGSVIPAGARVAVSYGSANRDERHYPDAHRFDITRKAADHLAFSAGIHACAGQGLAKLEASSIFRAMAEGFDEITLGGEPERALSNMTRGFRFLPIVVS